MTKSTLSLEKKDSMLRKKQFRVRITRIERYPNYKGDLDWNIFKQAIKETEEENYDNDIVIESVKVERL